MSEQNYGNRQLQVGDGEMRDDITRNLTKINRNNRQQLARGKAARPRNRAEAGVGSGGGNEGSRATGSSSAQRRDTTAKGSGEKKNDDFNGKKNNSRGKKKGGSAVVRYQTDKRSSSSSTQKQPKQQTKQSQLNNSGSKKHIDKSKKHSKTKNPNKKRQKDKTIENATLSATAAPFQPEGVFVVSKESPQTQANSKQPKGNKLADKKNNDGKKKKQAKKEKGKNMSAESSASNNKPPNVPQTTNDLNYGAGSKIVVLHVAEKPSIAQSIAKGLCPSGNINSVGKSLPVHEFQNPAFPKAPNASKVVHRVTSVAGHVFSVDFPSQYQSWESTDPLEVSSDWSLTC